MIYEQPPNKSILLLYCAMNTGGIETLILRMSNWLVNNNYSVELLLLKKEGSLLKDLHPNVKVSALGKYPELKFSFYYYFCKSGIKPAVIFSFSPLTTWMSVFLYKKFKSKPVVVNGIYHLYDYKLFADKYQLSVFDSTVPDNCKIFMTPAVKEEHEKILGRNLDNSMIWPLPIDTSKVCLVKRNPKKYKIVSVGRLVDFKTYNIYMIDVVKKLIDNGYPVEYYIYGDGELKIIIEAKVDALRLKEYVHLIENVEYADMWKVFEDTFAFVGMGTAVIESGIYKVPSITAIAYSEEPITHGYIHTLPKYICGEHVKDLPIYDVYDYLVKLINLSDRDYHSLCEDSTTQLKNQYDIDILMRDFTLSVDLLKQNNIQPQNVCFPVKYVISRTCSLILHKLKKTIGINV